MMATIPLGLYLWKRIHEIGVRTIVGLPGDFNLQLLDQIYNVPGLKWVGTANELNAAYAADGYARTKSGAGCLVTTHGVGELSALNGVAGAMTEQVKVIHVVGQTTRPMQKGRKLIHHSLGPDPDHQVYNKTSQSFRVAAAELQDVKDAPAEIDRVIRECFLKSCPVYIFMPLDLVDEHVSADLLDKPIDLSFPHDSSSEKAIEDATSAILEALAEAKNPAMLVDCLIQRHQAIDELKRLVEKVKFPVYTTVMGKGIIDEINPLYVGVYNGSISSPGVTEAFESSDLILLFGSIPCDTNTGGFTRKTPVDSTIEFKPFEVVVKGKTFDNTPYKALLPHLSSKLSAEKLPQVKIPTLPTSVDEADINSSLITQSWVWQKIAAVLQPGDVVFGETGTASFGMLDVQFPRDVTWITQTYFGSIGYATPAALGADMALKELAENNGGPRRRTVLITGDGSLQLTMGEIGTMIHYGLKPIIFLINNNGYTIERVIHGAKQKYNDIVPYNFAHALQLFGMSDAEAKQNFHRCTTRAELEQTLSKASVCNPEKVQIIEIVMDAFDAPWRLVSQVATRGEATVKKMRDAGFKVREPTVKN